MHATNSSYSCVYHKLLSNEVLWKMHQNENESDDLLKLYDEQFGRYLRLSSGFVSDLKDKKDRQICVSWIRRLCDLKSHSLDVKSNRNAFFQYFIQVMQHASLEGRDVAQNGVLQDFQHEYIQDIKVAQDPNWLEGQLYDLESIMKSPRLLPYFAHWSNDQKTYVAAKALPNHGALIYMAVCKDPTLGWENLSELVQEPRDEN